MLRTGAAVAIYKGKIIALRLKHPRSRYFKTTNSGALSLIWLYKIFQTRYKLCTGKDLYSSTTPPRPLRLCLMDTLADNPIVTILDPSITIV